MAGSHVGGVALSREETLRQQWAAEGKSPEEIDVLIQQERDRQAAQDAASDAQDIPKGSNQPYVEPLIYGDTPASPTAITHVTPNGIQPGPAPGTTAPDTSSSKGGGGSSGVMLGNDPLWATKEAANAKGRAEDARLEAKRLGTEAEETGNKYSQDIRAVGTEASTAADVRAGMLTDTGRTAAGVGLATQDQINNLGGSAVSTASSGASTIGKAGTTGATSLARAGETAANTAAAGGRSVTQAGTTAAGGLTSAGTLAASQAALAQKRLSELGQSTAERASELGSRLDSSAIATDTLAREAQKRAAPEQVAALAAIEATEGPSAAQSTLRAALNQAEQSNLSLSRSGRGWGGSASALSRAIDANAVAGQEAANESARLRATEDAARRAREASNLVAGGQLTAQQRALNDQATLEGLRQSGALRTAGADTTLRGLGLNTETQRAAEEARIRGGELGLTAEQAAANARLAGATTAAELGVTGAGQQLTAEQAAAATRLAATTEAGRLGLAGEQARIDAAKAAADARARGIDQELAAGQAAGGIELAGSSLAADTAARAADIKQTGTQTSGNLLQTGTALGYQGDTLAAQATQAEAAVNAANADRALQKYGIDQGVSVARGNETMQMIGAGLGAAATIAPFLLAASDRDTKEGIKPASNLRLAPDSSDPYGLMGPTRALGAPGNPAGPGGPEYDRAMKSAEEAKRKEALKAQFGSSLGAGLGAASKSMMSSPPNPYGMSLIQSSMPGGGVAISDERKKTNIERASDAVRKAPGYSFEYEDPERYGNPDEYEGDGKFYGPMAQDLEKTPVGRSTVKVAPDGTKMVDTSRLSLVNTAAIQELQTEVDRLKKLKGGTHTVALERQAPEPEYDADYARAYEAAADAAYSPPARSAREFSSEAAPVSAPDRGSTYDVVFSSRERPGGRPTLAESAALRPAESQSAEGWDLVYPEPRRRMRPSALPGARVARASDVAFYEPRSNLSL